MAVSIFHRVSGDGLAVVGGLSLIWWLAAAASGAQAFEYFQSWATSWIGVVIGVGLTWAFFQHMFGGIRHLILDTGAGYELKTNRIWSVMVFVGAILGTALVWFLILKGAN
jgi:succinate dehydrogenase / fumarate reductase cytochrome b subunit